MVFMEQLPLPYGVGHTGHFWFVGHGPKCLPEPAVFMPAAEPVMDQAYKTCDGFLNYTYVLV